MCEPDDILCEEPAEEPEEGGLIDTVLDTASDVASTAADLANPIDDIGEAAVGLATDSLEGFAAEMVDATNARLAEQASDSLEAFKLSVNDSLVFAGDMAANPLTATFRGAAGTIAAIAVLIILFSAVFKGIGRVTNALGPLLAFLVISGAGLTIIAGGVAASDQFIAHSVAANMGEVSTEGAGPMAAIIAPVLLGFTTVIFEIRPLILAALAGLWVFAAAMSISERFESFAPTVGALILANLLWPVLTILALVDGYNALPELQTTVAYILLALLLPLAANALAAGSVSKTVITRIRK